MGLGKYSFNNMINYLTEEKFTELFESEKEISIHLHTQDMIIRSSFVIDEFKIKENGLYITAGWREISVESNIVECIDEEDSLCIKFLNGYEIYIDQ